MMPTENEADATHSHDVSEGETMLYMGSYHIYTIRTCHESITDHLLEAAAWSNIALCVCVCV